MEGLGPAELAVLREAQRLQLLPADPRGLWQLVPAGPPGERLFALLRAAGVGGREEQSLRALYARALAAPAPATEPALPVQQARRFGAYLLGRELGRGGMGVVWEARHETLGRVVALKLVRLEGKDAGAESQRVVREAQALARLAHPGIVAVHDAGVLERTAFVAMHLVRGETLRARIQRAGRYPPRDGALLGAALADALAAAHQAGIVHRDVKPHNVLLEPDGTPVLTDFGLARLQDARSLTATGAMMGTPAYMPPEQVEGTRADARADVYSLGATLYEVLSGQPPFQGGSAVALINAVLNHAPPPLRPQAPAVSRELEAVVLRCLEKDPARRFQRAGELAAALRACAGGASRAGPRRRSTPLLVGGALLAVGAIGALALVAARRGAAQGSPPALAPLPDRGPGPVPAPTPPAVPALEQARAALEALEPARARELVEGLQGAEREQAARELLVAHALVLEGRLGEAAAALQEAGASPEEETAAAALLLLGPVEWAHDPTAPERTTVPFRRWEEAQERAPGRGEVWSVPLLAMQLGVLRPYDQGRMQRWIRGWDRARPDYRGLCFRAWVREFDRPGQDGEPERAPDDVERALATLQEASQMAPEAPLPLQLTAWIRYSSSDYRGARRDYARARELRPQRRDLPALLVRQATRVLDQAEAGAEEADLGLASLCLEVAIWLDPLDPQLFLQLARLELQRKGGELMAYERLGRSLFLDPGAPRAHETVLRLLDRWTPAPGDAEAVRKGHISQRCHYLAPDDPLALCVNAAVHAAAGANHPSVQEDALTAERLLRSDREWGPIAARVLERAQAMAR